MQAILESILIFLLFVSGLVLESPLIVTIFIALPCFAGIFICGMEFAKFNLRQKRNNIKKQAREK